MRTKLEELVKGMEHADLSALKHDSLPPVPEHIQTALTRLGGTIPNSDKPLYRIVSGLDPKLQEWAFGKFHRKYVSARDIVRQVTGVQTTHIRTQKKEFFPTEVAIKKGIIAPDGNITPYSKKTYFCILTSEDELIEYGIPRYIVEKWRSPDSFGTPEEWEDARYLEVGDPQNPTNDRIDALGDFPFDGRYDKFCNIEDGIEEEGKLTGTTFKPLSEAVIEQLADMIEMSNAPALETFEKIIKKADDKKAKDEAIFDDRLEQGIKENAGRLTNMPQIGYGGSSRKQG